MCDRTSAFLKVLLGFCIVPIWTSYSSEHCVLNCQTLASVYWNWSTFWPIIRMFVTIIWGYFDDPSLFISCQSTSKKIIQHMTLTVIRTYCTHCSCNLKLLVMLPLINFSEQFSSISTFLSFLLSEFSFF